MNVQAAGQRSRRFLKIAPEREPSPQLRHFPAVAEAMDVGVLEIRAGDFETLAKCAIRFFYDQILAGRR